VNEERMAKWMFCMNVLYEWYVIFKMRRNILSRKKLIFSGDFDYSSRGQKLPRCETQRAVKFSSE
jgi:hypothetical protein